MPIDPSIALGYRGIEVPNQLAQFGQVAQIQNAQNQNALAQYQIEKARREDVTTNAMNELLAKHVDPTTGQVNKSALFQDLAAGKMGAQILPLQKTFAEQEKSAAELGKLKAEAATKQTELFRGQLNNVQNPAQAAAWVQAQYADPVLAPIVKQVPMEQALAGIPTDPKAFAEWKNQNALGMSKWVERNTMTANEKAVDARARENIDIARQRLEKDSVMLDPAEQAAISKAIIDGRLDPYKINGRNAKMMAQTLIAKPDVNIKDLGIEAAGAGAAERALSTQSAKMSTAANEASKMINVAQDYSNKIDRTQYPTINAIQNAVDKGTGGEDIVKLNTAINALINSYARAISPTGNPTVSDKNHAREIVNANYSNGQLNGVFTVMQQEMQSAKSAAGETRAQLKAERTGKTTGAPNIDALLDKYKD